MRIVFASPDRFFVVMEGGYRETVFDRWFEHSGQCLESLAYGLLGILILAQLWQLLW